MSAPCWGTATTQPCPGPSERRLPCSPALSSVQQPVKTWGLRGCCRSRSAGTDPEPPLLSWPWSHTSHPLSVLHLSVSKSGTTNVRLVGLGGEDPASAGGARGRGLASGKHPRAELDRSNPGLRRLLPGPLGLRAREGRTSRRDGLWLRGMRPVARVLASPKLREQEGCWPPVTRRRGGGRGAFLVTLQRIENVPDQKKRWNRAAGVVWVCSFGLC